MINYYLDLYEERAAIIEFDANYNRETSERLARIDIEKQILKNDNEPVKMIIKLKKELEK